MNERIRNILTVLAVPLALTACGSTPDPGAEAGADDAVIVVNNNNSAISSATVYLVPESGVRRRLGTVTLDDTQRFTVDPVGISYQLLAEYGTQELVSREFSLSQGDVVTWDLNLNQVRFGGSAENR